MTEAKDNNAYGLQLRQLEAEIGAQVLRKRDLELELKAVSQSLDGLVKQVDQLKKEQSLNAPAG